MSVWRCIIEEFAVPGGLILERTAAPTFTDGYAVEPASDKYHLSPVAIHPARGKDMLLFAEGERSEETIVVYALDRLRTTQDPNGGQADRFQYDGKTFEVKTEQPWLLGHSDCNYYKFVAQKIPVKA